MPHVYRLETEQNGTGFYVSGHASDAECTGFNLYDTDKCPAPNGYESFEMVEMLDKEPDSWFFGFATIEQYRRWIPKKAREYFAQCNDALILCKYNIPANARIVGKTQAIFKREFAHVNRIFSPDAF